MPYIEQVALSLEYSANTSGKSYLARIGLACWMSSHPSHKDFHRMLGSKKPEVELMIL